MRVLFYLEPLVLHGRPFHHWSGFGRFAKICRALSEAGIDGRFLTNEALALLATAPPDQEALPTKKGLGVPAAAVSTLRQTQIAPLFDMPSAAVLEGLQRGTLAQDRVAAYGAMVRAALDGFVPDVIFTLTPADHLRAAFPDALVLHSESAAYSRFPYPYCWFLDPCGFWARSIPARFARALEGRELLPGERALLERFRGRFRACFAAMSPFGALERELRARFRRIGFLPLQYGGEPGFEASAPFRTQGELLLNVIERLPEDVALIVTEHGAAAWVGDVVDAETREFLERKYPNFRHVDLRTIEGAGQYVLHHADFVVSVSSSLGLQALLFEKPLVAIGTSHLATLATAPDLDAAIHTTGAPASEAIDRVLGWLVARYFVPERLTYEPAWLTEYLTSAIQRFRAGASPLELLPEIAPLDRLEALLFEQLDALATARFDAALANGDFTEWSRESDELRPAGWELCELHGDARVRRSWAPPGTPAARVRRRHAGGMTLLLQRIPGVERTEGAPVRLRFRARATRRTTLLTYFYLQVLDGGVHPGTPVCAHALDTEWREYQQVAVVPPLHGRRPRPGNHTEVVFALPPEAGAADFEITAVSLEPISLPPA
ncbi:MAG: hypothetical protein DIU78_022300, partial [Pseudomonadota bacterium]